MRINGRKLQPPAPQILVIPREDEDVVFKAQAVSDFEEFDRLVPRPTAPTVTPRGGKSYRDTDDRDYQKALTDWIQKRTHFIILNSLAPTPDLVWEEVDLKNPATWDKYIYEFKESGLTEPEIAKVMDLVTAANGMDEEKYKEARARFLAGQAVVQ